MAGSRCAASATRLTQALPALKGRSRSANNHDPRVAGKRVEKRGQPVRREARGPFGDVGIRFGESEHHRGRAPDLRFHRAITVADGPPRHFGDRWKPFTTSVVGGAPGPSGLGRRSIDRRAVRTGSRSSSEVMRACCSWRKPRAANSVHEGLGHRERAQHQRLRPMGQRRTIHSLGWVWRVSLARASAHVGAQLQRRDLGCRTRVGARPPGREGLGKEIVQQRQEGKGRSDAVRLLMRGTLRRV